MLKVLKNRFEQGCKTSRYPEENVQLLPRYRGRPIIQPDTPSDIVGRCAAACPQDAIDSIAKTIDMGRCVFCGTCARIADGRFVTFTQDFAVAVAEKAHLITQGDIPDLAHHSRQHFKKLFGRSLQLRQVSAAGCNACEADLNVLATPFFDLARFRHQLRGLSAPCRRYCRHRPHLSQYENCAAADLRGHPRTTRGYRRGELYHLRRSVSGQS